MEKSFQQALREARKLGDQTMTVAHALQYLGMTAHYQGELSKAEDYFRQALAIEEKLAPGSLAATANIANLGMIFNERGDLTQAERYCRRALEVEEVLEPDTYNVAEQNLNLGSIALTRNDLAAAEKYYRHAWKVLQELDATPAYIVNVLSRLVEVALLQNDVTKAEDYLRQAPLASEPFYRSFVLIDLGDVARARRDFAKGQEYYVQALAVLEQFVPGTDYVATLLNKLGEVELEQGDLVRATEYYQRGRSLWEKLAPGSANYAESLAGLAQIARRQQRPEAVAQFYDQALDALESQNNHLGGSDDVRSGFRARYADYYKDYIGFLMDQKKPEKAFQVSERLRARTLLESLPFVRIPRTVDQTLSQQERELRESLDAKFSRHAQLLNVIHSESQRAALDKEINDLLVQYKEIEGQIRTSDPAYAALTQPQPLTANQVQQELLDANTLLLEYSLGEEHSYVFLLSQTAISAYELPKRAEIEAAAGNVYDLLTFSRRSLHGESELLRKRRLTRADAKADQAIASLSRTLLEPLAHQLTGKRLLIVSDGALQYVPFALLPLPQPSASRGVLPLVAEHEIVNLPSASVLSVLRRQELARKPAALAVAILADPVFAGRDDRLRLDAAVSETAIPKDAQDTNGNTDLDRSAAETGVSSDGIFPRLPFTRREADAVAAIAGNENVLEALDFDASKATALSPRLKDYRIIHFATHGMLNNDHPDLSGLVLSLVDRKGQSQDGFLRMLDIYNMELNADLVVLSACQTAIGKQVGEEGLMGLTRGFMYAGAPRVLASLWKVDDEATAAMMKKFYESMLRDHQTPAAALRAAQQWMRTQKAWQSPYYWAGFILQGEWK
jgi:CHAT domain-containing protein/Tfp pilus assembly protein PilF